MRSTNMKRAFSLAIVMMLLNTIPLLAADVPLGHPVYPFLERADLLGLLDNPLPSARPYSRLTVASMLSQIEGREERLTPLTWEMLHEFEAEFSSEFKRLGLPLEVEDVRGPLSRWFTSAPLKRLGLYRNNRDAYSIYGPDWGAVSNVTYGTIYKHNDLCQDGGGEQRVFIEGLEGRAWLNRLTLELEALDHIVNGDPACFDTITYPYQNFGSPGDPGFDFYNFRTSFAYQDEHTLLYFGRGSNQWGPARENGLLLSGRTIPYTHFRLEAGVGPFKVIMVQAKLMADPALIVSSDTLYTDVIRYQYAEKWMAAHRIEWDLNRNLQLGLWEQVVYGERGFDVEYLHPIGFYRGAEHYNRDRDNVILGLDLRGKLFNRIALYGELLFDDLVFSDFLSEKSRGDRHALQVGTHIADPPLVGNSILTMEYGYVRPFVYTHKFQINIAQHYGTNLGSPLQPNSDRFLLHLYKPVHKRLTLNLEVSRMRHGANSQDGSNIGGDVIRSIRDNPVMKTPLLTGDLETTDQALLGVRLEPLYDIFLTLQLGWRSVRREVGKNNDGLLYGVQLVWHPMEW